MVDDAIAELASRQYGLFSRAQAEAAGCSRSLVQRRLTAGRWRLEAPGVYGLPGWPDSWRRSLMLAVLDAGGQAVVSHRAAAALHRFTAFSPGPVELTVPHGHHQRGSTAEVHQLTDLRACDRVVVDGLPATGPARTLFDLAAVTRKARFATALDDAHAGRTCSIEEVRAVYDALARPGKRGMRMLRSVLAERGSGYVPPGSELERRLLSALARGGLPPAARQVPVPWRQERQGRVDLAYPERRVIIEADGRRWHTREQDFEVDRQRDRAATLAGWSVYRFTWYEITAQPEAVCETVRQALARPVPSTSST